MRKNLWTVFLDLGQNFLQGPSNTNTNIRHENAPFHLLFKAVWGTPNIAFTFGCSKRYILISYHACQIECYKVPELELTWKPTPRDYLCVWWYQNWQACFPNGENTNTTTQLWHPWSTRISMTQILLECSCGTNGFVLTYWTQDSDLLSTWRAMPTTLNLTNHSGLMSH